MNAALTLADWKITGGSWKNTPDGLTLVWKLEVNVNEPGGRWVRDRLCDAGLGTTLDVWADSEDPPAGESHNLGAAWRIVGDDLARYAVTVWPGSAAYRGNPTATDERTSPALRLPEATFKGGGTLRPTDNGPALTVEVRQAIATMEPGALAGLANVTGRALWLDLLRLEDAPSAEPKTRKGKTAADIDAEQRQEALPLGPALPSPPARPMLLLTVDEPPIPGVPAAPTVEQARRAWAERTDDTPSHGLRLQPWRQALGALESLHLSPGETTAEGCGALNPFDVAHTGQYEGPLCLAYGRKGNLCGWWSCGVEMLDGKFPTLAAVWMGAEFEEGAASPEPPADAPSNPEQASAAAPEPSEEDAPAPDADDAPSDEATLASFDRAVKSRSLAPVVGVGARWRVAKVCAEMGWTHIREVAGAEDMHLVVSARTGVHMALVLTLDGAGATAWAWCRVDPTAQLLAPAPTAGPKGKRSGKKVVEVPSERAPSVGRRPRK